MARVTAKAESKPAPKATPTPKKEKVAPKVDKVPVSYTHLDVYKRQVGTSIGAIAGTSNVTTYVESAAGIGAGGRTGLTALVVAVLLSLIHI